MAPVGSREKQPRNIQPSASARRPAMKSRGRGRPEPQSKFHGSTREGHGFALRRKQKIEQEYKKLLRKERKVNPVQQIQYTENYPEHLKHLYLAEEEMLKKQQLQRKNKDHEKDSPKVMEQKENTVVKPSTTKRTTLKKKTSNQKAREEYEKIKAERAKKREEALKRKQEREEAQRLYKQRKMESYKILSKKTKKGQPNLNLQMEYLLQKIQQNT